MNFRRDLFKCARSGGLICLDYSSIQKSSIVLESCQKVSNSYSTDPSFCTLICWLLITNMSLSMVSDDIFQAILNLQTSSLRCRDSEFMMMFQHGTTVFFLLVVCLSAALKEENLGIERQTRCTCKLSFIDNNFCFIMIYNVQSLHAELLNFILQGTE